MFKLKSKQVVYYFGNIDTYTKAFNLINSTSSFDSMQITCLADAIINLENNTVIKSRFMLDEIFDEYYKVNNPMYIGE